MKKPLSIILIFAILNTNMPFIFAEDSSSSSQNIAPTPEEIEEAQEEAEEEEQKDEVHEEMKEALWEVAGEIFVGSVEYTYDKIKEKKEKDKKAAQEAAEVVQEDGAGGGGSSDEDNGGSSSDEDDGGSSSDEDDGGGSSDEDNGGGSSDEDDGGSSSDSDNTDDTPAENPDDTPAENPDDTPAENPDDTPAENIPEGDGGDGEIIDGGGGEIIDGGGGEIIEGGIGQVVGDVISSMALGFVIHMLIRIIKRTIEHYDTFDYGVHVYIRSNEVIDPYKSGKYLNISQTETSKAAIAIYVEDLSPTNDAEESYVYNTNAKAISTEATAYAYWHRNKGSASSSEVGGIMYSTLSAYAGDGDAVGIYTDDGTSFTGGKITTEGGVSLDLGVSYNYIYVADGYWTACNTAYGYFSDSASGNTNAYGMYADGDWSGIKILDNYVQVNAYYGDAVGIQTVTSDFASSMIGNEIHVSSVNGSATGIMFALDAGDLDPVAEPFTWHILFPDKAGEPERDMEIDYDTLCMSYISGCDSDDDFADFANIFVENTGGENTAADSDETSSSATGILFTGGNYMVNEISNYNITAVSQGSGAYGIVLDCSDDDTSVLISSLYNLYISVKANDGLVAGVYIDAHSYDSDDNVTGTATDTASINYIANVQIDVETYGSVYGYVIGFPFGYNGADGGFAFYNSAYGSSEGIATTIDFNSISIDLTSNGANDSYSGNGAYGLYLIGVDYTVDDVTDVTYTCDDLKNMGIDMDNLTDLIYEAGVSEEDYKEGDSITFSMTNIDIDNMTADLSFLGIELTDMDITEESLVGYDDVGLDPSFDSISVAAAGTAYAVLLDDSNLSANFSSTLLVRTMGSVNYGVYLMDSSSMQGGLSSVITMDSVESMDTMTKIFMTGVYVDETSYISEISSEMCFYLASLVEFEVIAVYLGSADSLDLFSGSINVESGDLSAMTVSENFYGYLIGKELASGESLMLFNDATKNSEGIVVNYAASISFTDIQSTSSSHNVYGAYVTGSDSDVTIDFDISTEYGVGIAVYDGASVTLSGNVSGAENYVDGEGSVLALKNGAYLKGDTYITDGATLKILDSTIYFKDVDIEIEDATLYVDASQKFSISSSATMTLTNATLYMESYAYIVLNGSHSLSLRSGTEVYIDLSDVDTKASYTIFYTNSSTAQETILDYLNSNATVVLSSALEDADYHYADYGDIAEDMTVTYKTLFVAEDDYDIGLKVISIGEFDYFVFEADEYGNLEIKTTTDAESADFSAYSKLDFRITNGTDGADVEYSFVNLSRAHTHGGAIYNDASTAAQSIGNITGDFVGNSVYTSSGSVRGGAIENYASYDITIGDITGDFITNYAYSKTSFAKGGAISNLAEGAAIKIGTITGDFISNYVYSLEGTSTVQGGAIYNYATGSGASIYIESIVGSFIDNYAFSVKDSAQGGALFNESLEGTSITIDSIVGDFISNYAANYATGDETSAGGAIYNNANGSDASITLSISGSFIGNYAYIDSADGTAHGGAIYNYAASGGSSTINLSTSDSDIYFTGNYTNKAGEISYSAIYNSADSSSAATINFTTTDSYSIIVNDAITGSATNTYQVLNIAGSVEFNNEVSNQTINLNSGTLTLGAYAGTSDLYEDGTNVSVISSIASLSNSTLTAAADTYLYIGTNENFDSVNLYGSSISLATGSTLLFDAYAGLYLDETSSITFGEGSLFSIDFSGIYGEFEYTLFTVEDADTYASIKTFLSNKDNLDVSSAYLLLVSLTDELANTVINYGDSTADIGYSFTLNYDDTARTIDIEFDVDGDFAYFVWSTDDAGNLVLTELDALGYIDMADYSDIIAYSSDNSREENGSGDITHSFLGLSDTQHGGAIFNKNVSTIDSITGDFVGNTASVSGGAIYNEAYYYHHTASTIGGITGDFVGNGVTSTTTAQGGAIYNYADYGMMSIGAIVGDFVGNYVYSKNVVEGGAIYNYAIVGSALKIDSITGDFITNYLYAYNGDAHGGAIYNYSNDSTLSIGSITGDFIGNYAYTENGTAEGGAIYNYAEGDISITGITGSFIGNYAYSENGTAEGGAIYNYAGYKEITMGISADAEDIYFTGNYTYSAGDIVYNAIYNAGGYSGKSTINFSTEDVYSIVVNDGISGDSDHVSSQILNIAGAVEFNNSVQYQTINVNSGTLTLGSYEGTSDLYGDGSNVEVGAATASLTDVNLTVKEDATLSISGSGVSAYSSTITLSDNSSVSFDIYSTLYLDENTTVSLGDNLDLSLDVKDTSSNFDYTILTIENDTVYNKIFDYLTSLYLTVDIDIGVADYGDEFLNIAFEGDGENIDIYTYLAGEVLYFEWTTFGGYDNIVLVEIDIENAESADLTAYSAANNRIVGSTYWADVTDADLQASFVGLLEKDEDAIAQGGAIYNESSTVEIAIGELYGDFIGNAAESTGNYVQGGAIYSSASTYDISFSNMYSNFYGNSATTTVSYAQGGAIYNAAISADIEYLSISANFYNNYAYSSHAYTNDENVQGGAIYNYVALDTDETSPYIYIGGIIGDFDNNYVYSVNTNAMGGAIYNESYSDLDIDYILSDFYSNYAAAHEDGNAYGGAIYNYTNDADASIVIGSITGDFLGNYAYSLSGNAYGGAIYNYAESGSIELTLSILNGDMQLAGNYLSIDDEITYNAIYNGAGETGTSTIYLYAGEDCTLSINDSITGGEDYIENQILVINYVSTEDDVVAVDDGDDSDDSDDGDSTDTSTDTSAGIVSLNNTVENQTIALYSGTLELGGYAGTDDLFDDDTNVEVEASTASLVNVTIAVLNDATLEFSAINEDDVVSLTNTIITVAATATVVFDDTCNLYADSTSDIIFSKDDLGECGVNVEFYSTESRDLVLGELLEFILEDAATINHNGLGTLTVNASLHESTEFNLKSGTLNFAGELIDGILNVYEGTQLNIIISDSNLGSTNILTGTLNYIADSTDSDDSDETDETETTDETDDSADTDTTKLTVGLVIDDIFKALNSTTVVYDTTEYPDMELALSEDYSAGVDLAGATLTIGDSATISQYDEDGETLIASATFAIVDSKNNITVSGAYVLGEGESYNIDTIDNDNGSLTLDGGELSLNAGATLVLGGDDADVIAINATLNAVTLESLISVEGDIEVGDLTISGNLYGDDVVITGSSLNLEAVNLTGSISFSNIEIEGDVTYDIADGEEATLLTISEDENVISGELYVTNSTEGSLIVYEVTSPTGSLIIEDGAVISLTGNGYALTNNHEHTGANGIAAFIEGKATIIGSIKVESPFTLIGASVTEGEDDASGSFVYSTDASAYKLTLQSGSLSTGDSDSSNSDDVTVYGATLVLDNYSIDTSGGDINLYGAILSLDDSTLSNIGTINMSTSSAGEMSMIEFDSSSTLGGASITIVGSSSMLKDATYTLSSSDLSGFTMIDEYGDFSLDSTGKKITVDSLTYFQDTKASNANESALAYALDNISADGESVGDEIYDAKLSFKITADAYGLDSYIMNSYSNIAEVDTMLVSNLNFANVNRARSILDKAANPYINEISEEEVITSATGVEIVESQEVSEIKYSKVAQLQSINLLGSKDSSNGVAGYDYWSVGSTANIDYILSDTALVGFSMGGSYNKTEGDTGDNANSNAFLLNFYGVAKSGIYPFEIFANVGYAHFWNEASKSGASAKWDSDAFNALAGIAFEFDTDLEGFVIKPTAMLNMAMLNSEGASYSNGANIDKQSYISAKLIAGLEFEYAINAKFNAVLRAMYSYECGDESYNFDYTYSNGFMDELSYIGGEAGTSSAVIGFGLSYDFSETCTAYFDYTAYLYESLTTHSLNLSVAFKF